MSPGKTVICLLLMCNGSHDETSSSSSTMRKTRLRTGLCLSLLLTKEELTEEWGSLMSPLCHPGLQCWTGLKLEYRDTELWHPSWSQCTVDVPGHGLENQYTMCIFESWEGLVPIRGLSVNFRNGMHKHSCLFQWNSPSITWCHDWFPEIVSELLLFPNKFFASIFAQKCYL